jgi:PPK2 family polyphosphate:nucleotide phosphotransferase
VTGRERDLRAHLRVPTAGPFSIGKVDPDQTPVAPGGKDETRDAAAELVDELAGLQERLWAEDRRSVLVVFQAMDAGGKDGAIKKVFTGINPQGVEVTSFKVPSDEELQHDFLWRVHKRTPRRGSIGIFNRSHYEDVLTVRVNKFAPEDVWRPRYGQIRSFEDLLVANGTTVLKFMLHISKEEQAERFQSRLDRPDKRWKFRKGDLGDRAQWDEFMHAFEEAMRETSTERAPWYVIPANRKWYRDWAVLRVLVDTLREMDPQFPEPEEDLDGVVVQ